MRCPLVAAALLAASCASPGHLADPVAQKVTCDVTSKIAETLSTYVPILRVPLWILELLYTPACETAAVAGASQQDAEHAGLEGARRSGAALARSGLVLPASAPSPFPSSGAGE